MHTKPVVLASPATLTNTTTASDWQTSLEWYVRQLHRNFPHKTCSNCCTFCTMKRRHDHCGIMSPTLIKSNQFSWLGQLFQPIFQLIFRSNLFSFRLQLAFSSDFSTELLSVNHVPIVSLLYLFQKLFFYFLCYSNLNVVPIKVNTTQMYRWYETQKYNSRTNKNKIHFTRAVSVLYCYW